MEVLLGLPADLGPWALLGTAVVLVLTGAIPTRRELRDVQADRDHYRQAFDTLQAAFLKQGMTNEKLLAYAETTDQALREISRAVLHVRAERGEIQSSEDKP